LNISEDEPRFFVAVALGRKFEVTPMFPLDGL